MVSSKISHHEPICQGTPILLGCTLALTLALTALGRGRMKEVLVIDTGENLCGVYAVADRQYTPYRGAQIAAAIARIQRAAVVVTYNGKRFDFVMLGRYCGLENDELLTIDGEHVDMREVCWSDRIFGSSLANTYLRHFDELPPFEDSHEGSNRLDCELTCALYELWKQGKLLVIDGHEVRGLGVEP